MGDLLTTGGGNSDENSIVQDASSSISNVGTRNGSLKGMKFRTNWCHQNGLFIMIITEITMTIYYHNLSIEIAQSHHNHASSRSSADAQQSSQVSAAEIMSAAGLAAMAAAELGEIYYI